VVYRDAGDRFLLVEYGAMELDLGLNFFAVAAYHALSARRLAGVEDVAPGLRSLVVRYDPLLLSRPRLQATLDELHAQLQLDAEIPSRIVELPLAFDDSASREAVRRYTQGVRADAPYAVGDTNVDFVAEHNGLSGREELYDAVAGGEWWTAFVGFFPGVPFLLGLDRARVLSAPKYNPTRIWTPSGAVGLGGPCLCIYTVESPGGYQLLGRTLSTYDPSGRTPAFGPSGVLLAPGDRLRFVRVEEDELTARRADAEAGRYAYRIEPSSVRVSSHIGAAGPA
jgi:urea carboxylase